MVSRRLLLGALKTTASIAALVVASTFATSTRAVAQVLPGGGGAECTAGGGMCCKCTITWNGPDDFEITGCATSDVSGSGSCKDGTRAGGGNCGGNCAI